MKTIVSEVVISIIKDYLNSQDEKGIEKYGKSIDHVKMDDYDWNTMALEELADCIKYVVIENMRLKDELKKTNETLKLLNSILGDRLHG